MITILIRVLLLQVICTLVITILITVLLLQVMCTLVAIILHYFFLCSFAWMFVESLHVYRRMTDIHDVNHGPMRFYYVVGYGEHVKHFITSSDTVSMSDTISVLN